MNESNRIVVPTVIDVDDDAVDVRVEIEVVLYSTALLLISSYSIAR
jgi:hypothetical protein